MGLFLSGITGRFGVFEGLSSQGQSSLVQSQSRDQGTVERGLNGLQDQVDIPEERQQQFVEAQNFRREAENLERPSAFQKKIERRFDPLGLGEPRLQDSVDELLEEKDDQILQVLREEKEARAIANKIARASRTSLISVGLELQGLKALALRPSAEGFDPGQAPRAVQTQKALQALQQAERVLEAKERGEEEKADQAAFFAGLNQLSRSFFARSV